MAHNRLSRKRFATLLLACMMLLSFCAFVFAACATSDEDEDEDNTTETRTDTQTFANANFEYFSDNDGKYLIAGADSWTNSTESNGSGTSASSSVSKSGIVDTSFDWGDATKGFYQAYADYLKYDQMQEDDPDNPELDDAEYYTDIDNYYDIPGWDIVKAELEKEDSSVDLTDADTIVDHADEIAAAAKALNPGTHWSGDADEDKLNEENGTHVLMLHNYRSDGRGTAQKYTSSSITLSAGTEAMFSVWVNTKNLSYDDGKEFEGNRGAYIAVTNTVGGTSQDKFVVRNIITNGEWQQYTFYVKASDYAATTFAVELGLGSQDNGNDANRASHVQGYAFFDDLHYEIKTAGAFDVSDVPDDQQFTIDLTHGNSFTDNNGAPYTAIKADEKGLNDGSGVRAFVVNLKDITTSDLSLELDTTNDSGLTEDDYAYNENGIRPTTDDRDNTIEKGATGLSQKVLDNLIQSKSTDMALSGWKTAAELTADSQPAALREAFENYGDLPFADSRVLLLYSSQGAPYTASATASDANLFTLSKDEYLLITFWVKTSDLRGGTGATVSVVETGTDAKTSIGAVDTTTLTAVDLTDDYNGKKGSYGDEGIDGSNVRQDIFDGWQQCFFFVSNSTDNDISFTLEFSYGVTGDFSSTTAASYVPGFAAFAGFEYTTLKDTQYNSKTTGTYAVDVALSGNDTSASSSFDDVTAADSENIKTGFGDPANYDGVYGDSHYVGGSIIEGDQSKKDANPTAGLLDKEYAENYFSESSNSVWMDILNNSNWYTGAFDQTNWWTTLFGSSSTRPLLIVNTVEQAYGYIASSSSTISTSSYTAVTVRVKLSPGATANVYLIDTTAPEITDDDLSDPANLSKRYTDTLKYNSGISYRYDNSGNVVERDPEDEGFSTMNDTLFTYQKDNGLWLPYGSSDTSVYYANLANYDTDEETGDLLDSDGNVVYYASDIESEKGTVYYRYKDADTDELSVPVKDFTEAVNDSNSGVSEEELQNATLQDLRDPSYEKSLMQTVTNDSDTVSDWIYVRFFIATGDVSKDYRLEVWSGDRTGTDKNAAGSFVAFEMVNYGTIDADTFSGLVSLRVDELIDAYNANKPADAQTVRNEEELIEAYRSDTANFVNGTYGATEVVYFLYSLYDDNDYASYDANYSDSTNSPYADYDATTYTDTVSFLRTNYDSVNGRPYYDTYVNFAASDITVASSSSDDDTSTDDSTDETPTYNVWLLIISIILAAVLIFTLIVLLIRKLLSNLKKRPSKPAQSYDNKRKRYIRKLKLEEAEKDDTAEDVLPEDDEITEEDIYKVETDEEKAEEPAENTEESDEAQGNAPAEEKKDE